MENRDKTILELIRKKQKFLSFLKTMFNHGYTEEEIDKIIEDGEKNNAILYSMVYNIPLLKKLDVDEMEVEDVYDVCMNKKDWILLPPTIKKA